jgi:hypothetical protein
MSAIRKWLLGALLFGSLFVLVFAAYGGGWGGVRATGGSLTVTGEGYGLGQVDEAQITAQLSGYIICINNGSNYAPGQNSYSTTLTQSQRVNVRNGRFSFTFHFSDEDILGDQATWEGAGCPNSNWTVDYLHNLLTFTLNEVEDGVVVNKTAASFRCEINPPAASGEYVCTQQ